jgi:hypothetical protein
MYAYLSKPGRDFRRIKTSKKCSGFVSRSGGFLLLGNYTRLKNGTKTKGLFLWETAVTKVTAPKNMYWVLVPVKIASINMKLGVKEKQRKNQSYFGQEVTGTKVIDLDTLLSFGPGQDRFRYNYLCDIQ